MRLPDLHTLLLLFFNLLGLNSRSNEWLPPKDRGSYVGKVSLKDSWPLVVEEAQLNFCDLMGRDWGVQIKVLLSSFFLGSPACVSHWHIPRKGEGKTAHWISGGNEWVWRASQHQSKNFIGQSWKDKNTLFKVVQWQERPDLCSTKQRTVESFVVNK
jgi:hypothetical protein